MKSILKLVTKEILKNKDVNERVCQHWDKTFKQAILNGDVPENDLFETMKNFSMIPNGKH